VMASWRRQIQKKLKSHQSPIRYADDEESYVRLVRKGLFVSSKWRVSGGTRNEMVSLTLFVTVAARSWEKGGGGGSLIGACADLGGNRAGWLVLGGGKKFKVTGNIGKTKRLHSCRRASL